MSEEHCPICTQQLKRINQSFSNSPINSIDLQCMNTNHSFIKRKIEDIVTDIKIRLTEPDNSNLFLKIDYVAKQIYVWSLPNERNQIVLPLQNDFDISNIEKLRKKLQSYLLMA